MKAKKLVIPGTVLSTVEEYEPGSNTFETANGEVISESIGEAVFDNQNRVVSVKAILEAKPLDVGSTVIARVALVKEKNTLVEIVSASNANKPRKVTSSYASIPIFDASNDFVERMSNLFKVGDIVKAKVTKVTSYGIDLQTKDNDLGVIKAFDSRTRQPLTLFGTQLKCTSSANVEERKISSDYICK